MLRFLLHPAVVILIAAVLFVWWARRTRLRLSITRAPTPREWAILTLLAQFLRRFLRFRF